MLAGLKRTVEPVGAVVDRDGELKPYLRITDSDSDALLDSLLLSATTLTEEAMRRALLTQTWQATWDRFGWTDDKFVIPRPELISVTSLEYKDNDGTSWATVSASDYDTDALREPAVLRIRDMPSNRHTSHAPYWRLTYVAGYGAASDVPEPVIVAIMEATRAMYDGCELEGGLWQNIVDRYKIRTETLVTTVRNRYELIL